MSGRKHKLNKKLIEDASKLISAGNYAITVCGYLGISESVWYKWIADGEKMYPQKDKIKDEYKLLCIEFYETIKKANAVGEIKAVNEILTDDSWQSKAWYLERRFGDRWGRKEKIEHSGRIDGEHNINLKHLTDEELEKELKKLE